MIYVKKLGPYRSRSYEEKFVKVDQRKNFERIFVPTII